MFFQRMAVWTDGYFPGMIHYSLQDDERTVLLESRNVPVTGKVLDSFTNNPIAGAQVVLNGETDRLDETVITSTDANGVFLIEIGFLTREYKASHGIKSKEIFE